ncbi:NADH-quinone oxidoreductase subunit G [bacterium HR19]|nr:NADH-quinone oxidoreductase subunit G [bacterium HR19]
MPILKIDGKEVEVEKGTNLVLAALKAGVYIPHYCYHPLLPVVAQCRMCLVKIEGTPKPTPACTVYVDKDMSVDTQNEQVKKLRNTVLELLLQHHPVDCPVCPRSGECDLQNFTYIWGPEQKRYDGVRRLKGWSRVSEKILLFKERCVLCTRCVRFLEKYSNSEIQVTRRAFASDLMIFPEKFAGSNYSGNIIDLCPVGALVDEVSNFMPRAWRVKKALTRCALCERGCRIIVESWKGEIVRVKTFDNMLDKAENHLYSKVELVQPAYEEIEGIEEIGEHSYEKLYSEDLMICDIGRWGWREFFYPRDTKIMVAENGEKKEIDWESCKKILKVFAEHEKKAIFITPFATNEEMRVFSELAEKSNSKISLLPPIIKQGDKILLKDTRAPNLKGGEKIIGGVKQEVIDGAKNGEFSAVLFYGLGADKTKLNTENIKAKFLIIIDNKAPEPNGNQFIFIPATLPYEKRGTYEFEGNSKRIYPVVERRPNETEIAKFLISIL